MKNLDTIINELKNIRTITKTKVSDEVLFENAIKLFISNNINESQNKRRNIFGTEVSKKIDIFSKENKPTEKQIAFLKKNKVKVPETKSEARQMISNYIDNLKKENI